MSKIFFDKIPVVQVTDEEDVIYQDLITIIQNDYTRQKAMDIDTMIFDLYNLSTEERNIIGFVEIE